MISTQYARNGALLEESRQYSQLLSAGIGRDERRRILLVENGLGRSTFKTRRSIFEALKLRLADERRAAHLGTLSLAAGASRAFSVGVFLEIARHDELIHEFAKFLAAQVGSSAQLLDARRFLEEIEHRFKVVHSWAPSLQRRAVSSLNAMPRLFHLWHDAPSATVAPIELPTELFGIIFLERLADDVPALQAPEFELLGVARDAVVQGAWACARRGWFDVDAAAGVASISPLVRSVAEMFPSAHTATMST